MEAQTLQLENATRGNTYYRHILQTTPHLQLVVMSLHPQEEIGWEQHSADQFMRVEDGRLLVETIADSQYPDQRESWILENGDSIIIPGGLYHNVTNPEVLRRGALDSKFYVIYSPPQHPDGLIEVQRPSNEQ